MKREKIKELIAQMTLEEKAGMCSGADFWHLKGVERLRIPSVMERPEYSAIWELSSTERISSQPRWDSPVLMICSATSIMTSDGSAKETPSAPPERE